MRRLTNLLPHQQLAFNKIKKNKVGALFMDMGTGKTRTVIELLNSKFEQEKINKILYCSPFSIIDNVKEQFEKHCPEMLNITKFCGIESLSLSSKLYLEVFNYVNDKTAIVVDESTLIKNHTAKRTKRLLDLSKKCKYKYILSGCPVTRDISDLFSQFYFLSPAIFEYCNWYEFANNHVVFHSHYKNRILRTKNENYLAEKMQPYVFKVKKEECLSLPPQNYENRYCITTEEEDIQYNELKLRCFEKIIEDPTGIEFCGMLECLLHFSAKIKKRQALLKETLEEIDLKNNKLLIFCKHIDTQKQVELMLRKSYKIGSISGETKPKDRKEIIENFRENLQILILNYGVGSYGLNLQEANYIIYYEQTFDYGLIEQSENRIHRIGQNKKCFYIKLLSDLKIDSFVNNNITKKINIVYWFEKEIDKINLCEEADKRKYLQKLLSENF